MFPLLVHHLSLGEAIGTYSLSIRTVRGQIFTYLNSRGTRVPLQQQECSHTSFRRVAQFTAHFFIYGRHRLASLPSRVDWEELRVSLVQIRVE